MKNVDFSWHPYRRGKRVPWGGLLLYLPAVFASVALLSAFGKADWGLAVAAGWRAPGGRS